jgi:precorrin-3B C17-methyltransferase/precorrin-6y C5,15-methyltransferase (decarboxylating) CbiE subunit/precorrin-6Y C5,15-methyltransferase (decarboxylating) CbiT subunit
VGEPVVDVVGLLGGRPVGREAEAAVRGAALVAGSPDQLAAVADLLADDATTVIVQAGLHALDQVADHPGPACVLASGDPGFHGIGRALRHRFGADRVAVHPAPTSVALACARLGLSWDDIVVASCHRGEAARAAAIVARVPTAAVLCGPAAPPEAVGSALLALGAHHAMVAVASRIGEPGESLTRLPDLAALAAGTFPHRSVVVLDQGAAAAPSVAATAAGTGRPVDAFAHRAGMITKPEVRSVVLGRLDLPARGVLWDVGAGSGSVAIEAALAAPGLRVIAVERAPADAERILANAAALGALVEVVVGSAPEALANLPVPDRVFVGGGGLDVLDACVARARPGARVVASFAAVDRAVAARTRLGALVQVAVDRAVDLPDGGVRFVADNPVFVAWGDVGAPDIDRPAATTVALGLGCSTHATADEVTAVAVEALAAAGLDAATVIATIDRRRDHPAMAGRDVLTFGPLLLDAVDVPNPSDLVADAVGTSSVAEAAALLAAGPGARLVATKVRGGTATAAVAVGAPARSGAVVVLGLGPGGAEHRTPAAVAALRSADAVVGYRAYVDAVEPLLAPGQLVLRAGMGEEAARAEAACQLAAAGWRVAVVSSGDPGVFAMSAVVLAAAADLGVAVELIPGVTAAHAAGAASGYPLGGPHAVLTLSDLLLPSAVIEAQLRAAAGAGLGLALYNPRSAGRPDHLERARVVLLEHLPADTLVVVVDDATGPAQRVTVTTLADLDPEPVGMRSVVLVAPGDPRRR